MNTRFIVALSLAAGFMGGFVSRYLEPPPVFAQTPASPREIRAQKFVLVDETGAARGVFGIEENGSPQIEVIAYKGRVFAALFQSWSLVHGILAQSASPGPKKPTLLPVKP